METQDIDGLAASPEWVGAEITIEVGAHLVSEREGYTHHGIYAGNRQVIHYGGFHHSDVRRPIEYVSLHGFAAGRAIKLQAERHAIYTGAAAVERAKSRLGEDQYRLLTNNCEHFCTWCLLGVGRSEQVRRCLTNPWTGLRTLFALAREMRGLHERAKRPHRDARRLPRLVVARS
ncbi:lecithin retinol acyltransferase family protein [Paraburkholderia rhynchosiae]|uniref:Hydrolase n=1 Tax=Paraburkholderia rhynchosiae TaxID=487049 RepID=A0ABX4V814_9BURK|nr:lecithin retinol acyltransferase family protein [Paraburkholderia rhynchosiae]PMS29898.1 hydrolase [Paraburkholderia rhynchosiae]